MGRKSSAKARSTSSSPASSTGGSSDGSFKGILLAGLAVALVAIGVFAFRGGSSGTEPAASADAAAQTPAAPTPEIEKYAATQAAYGPRNQPNLPPLPAGYQPPRSMDVVSSAYQFAAEHPEILSYVPCFCGCEHAGHKGNTDCFVKSRNAQGDVTAWDEHGMSCAVCIDVANRSRQMHASGASVRDIRTAIDKEFGPVYAGKMPTPQPPAAHSSH